MALSESHSLRHIFNGLEAATQQAHNTRRNEAQIPRYCDLRSSALPFSGAVLVKTNAATFLCASESFANTAQGQISYESLAEIMEAFLAAYAIARRPKKSPLSLCHS
jgi:hypothetical protein